MKHRSKWLWGVTLANVAVAFLLIVTLFGIMLALAVLAPEISGWPLYVILPLGIALSITGLRFTRCVASRCRRYISYSVNGCALALHVFVIIGFAAVFMSDTKERFLIPDGYKGDLYVIYGVPDGETLNRTHRTVTYRIPKDGVLRVQGRMTGTWTRTEYNYLMETGKVERIRNFWPSTIDPTADNLANDRDVGVFFPRTGRTTDSTGCSVEFQQFYVGTKAHLLRQYKEMDISKYLEEHPLGCIS